MNSTAALVVTYNRVKLLRRCLLCLAGQTQADFDIIVVDNASTDGTAALCREMLPGRLKYYNTGKNLGGAGGFAFAAAKATAAGYAVLWMMDDDTLPQPQALEQLRKAADGVQGVYGWLSSRALAPDGSDQAMNVQRCTPYRDLTDMTGETKPAVMASFVSLYLKAETVRHYGLPIAEFFIWSDDWEYTRRISRKEPCYVVPASRVVHAMQNPTVVNIATDTPDRWDRYRYFYRNDVYLYRREGITGWLWLLAKDAWHSVQVLGGSGGKKWLRLGIIWKNFFAGIRFRPAIRYPQQPGIND